jgi:adenine C2-methylase RlmN of 23S rRNA A2503 and tRNA A37
MEVSYIDKGGGKDIICVPCQTACNMKCKFCHITDIQDELYTSNLHYNDIKDAVIAVLADLTIPFRNDKDLLISYMGCGEPLMNWSNVVNSMVAIQGININKYKNVRFGLATSLPKSKWLEFYELTDTITRNKLNVKIHLSLHYTDDETRKKWMPNSLEIKPSISALQTYHLLSGNPVEIHYALIEDVNDYYDNAHALCQLLVNTDINVKVLMFNEKESLDERKSPGENITLFRENLSDAGVQSEYYVPPGLDIGASCGQINSEYYLKYNKKE